MIDAWPPVAVLRPWRAPYCGRVSLSARAVPTDPKATYFHYQERPGTGDARHQRYAADRAGTLTYYQWDGLNQLVEKDSSLSTTARHTHGHAPVPGIASVVTTKRGVNFQYPHYDHRGSLFNLEDTGAADLAAEYNAFGKEISRSGAAVTRFGYQGTAWLRYPLPDGTALWVALADGTRPGNPTAMLEAAAVKSYPPPVPGPAGTAGRGYWSRAPWRASRCPTKARRPVDPRRRLPAASGSRSTRKAATRSSCTAGSMLSGSRPTCRARGSSAGGATASSGSTCPSSPAMSSSAARKPNGSARSRPGASCAS